MELPSLVWIGAVLLLGGVWLVWGWRVTGVAMLGTFGLANLVTLGAIGFHARSDSRERGALEAEARAVEEDVEPRQEVIDRMIASCTASGGTWMEDDEICEAADEAATARTAREAESLRIQAVDPAE